MVKSEPEAEDGPGPMPCKLPASSSSSPPCHDPVSVAISSSSTTSAMSVFFNRCLCCSLLTGSVLTGVYATVTFFAHIRTSGPRVPSRISSHSPVGRLHRRQIFSKQSQGSPHEAAIDWHSLHLHDMQRLVLRPGPGRKGRPTFDGN